MRKPTLGQMVAFCILMQNGRGIMSKSEGYMIEKYEECMALNSPRGLLDSSNQAIYDAWFVFWCKDEGRIGA